MNDESYITKHYKGKEPGAREPLNLSLFIDNQLFLFALFNENYTLVHELCHVRIASAVHSAMDLPETIRFLLANYRLDQRAFKNVNICILNTSFTITPEAFIPAENAKSFLEFTNGAGQVKNAFSHTFDQISFCYSISGDLVSLLERTFKNAAVRHAGAVTIDLLFSNTSLKNCDLLLNFNAGVFELAAKKNNKLLYYNVFNYESNEDVLYYLLFMMEQYGLNPLTCRLAIAGQMETGGELMKAVRKYIKQVSLAVNDKSFSSSFADVRLPDHYFFSLTNQHLCVS